MSSVSFPSIPREAIRERAYFLWEARGRPTGAAIDHWLQAEREMVVELVEAATDPIAITLDPSRQDAAFGLTPLQSTPTVRRRCGLVELAPPSPHARPARLRYGLVELQEHTVDGRRVRYALEELEEREKLEPRGGRRIRYGLVELPPERC